jgi:putative salt-induced outer membrane protein YdiY
MKIVIFAFSDFIAKSEEYQNSYSSVEVKKYKTVRKESLYEEFKKINNKYKKYRVDISTKGLDRLYGKTIEFGI